MRVNREELLKQLELVRPGLAPREEVEQSSCFLFQDGRIRTYNEEISCSIKTKLPITGAVASKPLIAILQKLPEEEVEVTAADGELHIQGKKKEAGIRMEKDIVLKVEVEKPKEWKKLHADFTEAVRMAQLCAGTDESQFSMTCVHIHPKWVEGCDNYQMTRYKIKTGITTPTLVRGSSIKHITQLDFEEFAETDSWLHFRSPSGLVLSCRRFVEEYLDLSTLMNVEGGVPTALPKGLAESAEKAEVFSSDNANENVVKVELKPGKLRLRGEGASGWYSEVKSVKYDGPNLMFHINPRMLADLVQRHDNCEITETRLRVQGERYTYVTCLATPDANGKEEKDG